MKYRIVLLLTFLVVSLSITSQNQAMKQILDYLPTWKAYPFMDDRVYPDFYQEFIKPIGFSEHYGNLPIYAWENIQCTQQTIGDEKSGTLFLKFIPDNKSYELACASIGESEPQRTLLITYNNNGEMLDFIEGGVSFSTDIIIKQYSVNRTDSGLIVTIYYRKPSSGNSLLFADLLQSKSGYNGQRIDSVYKIDDMGHFIQISNTAYQPKDYTYEELTNAHFNIWNGAETK